MSKKSQSATCGGGGGGTDDGSPPATAVDFIFRTMIQRASAPGKRQIRPKNVDELLQSDIQELGSDEDPDFDVSKDKHHNESDVSIGSDDDEDDVSSNNEKADDNDGDESEDEDDSSYDANRDKGKVTSDSEEEAESSSEEESSAVDTDSQSPVQKKSALRETLKKLNDSEFTPQQKRRRKKPKKVTSATGLASAANNSANGKGKSVTKKSEESSKNKKKSKSVNNKSKTINDGDVNKSSSKVEDSKSKKAPISNKKKVVVGSKNKVKIKDEVKSKKKKKKDRFLDNSGHKSITDMVGTMEKCQKENRKEIDLGNPICSACLGKSSDEMNEIVECDSCGITVHEACYGVSDTLSVCSSSGSSCSTEPWFCDACKTGSKTVITCELCPMKGGLFKETTAGRWVHLVCALYTPGVVIMEIGLPSLFEIPYSKWGSHPCSVCDDIRYSRSGICIPCDAGMCKTYLHATCAQKHGLLSDPVPQNTTGMEVEADPYFAACKLHINRETSKRRAKSYGILQEQLRIKKEQKLSENLTPHQRYNQTRIRRKLERIRFRVAIKQAHSYTQPTHPRYSSSSLSTPLCGTSSNSIFPPTGSEGCLPPLPTHLQPQLPISNTNLPPSWREGNKKTRLLSTSAATARSFVHKADLMGLNIKALELEDKNCRIVTSVSRKWNVLPGLGVEFAAYYADREIRINTLSDQCEKLEKENNQLNDQQMDLQGSFDTHSVHSQLMSEDTEKMRIQLIGLSEVLKTICPLGNKKLISSLNGIVTKSGDVSSTNTSPSSRRRSPSHSNSKGGAAGKANPKAAGSKKSKKGNKTTASSPVNSVSPARSFPERLSIKVCSVCSKSEEQPWIIRCDHCNKFYHLKCLDPPLTRIPKRSRLCGWMCSDCGEEELEAEEAQVDTEAPRTLRGRTKIRKPGKYRNSTDSRDDDVKIVGIATGAIDIDKKSPAVIISPLQMKLEVTSPVLTNGNLKSSTRRRSGNSSNNTSLSSSSIASTPAAESILSPPKNVEAKKELFSSPLLKPSSFSPFQSPITPTPKYSVIAVKSSPQVVLDNLSPPALTPQPKKGRKRKGSANVSPPLDVKSIETKATPLTKTRKSKEKKVKESPLSTPPAVKKAKVEVTTPTTPPIEPPKKKSHKKKPVEVVETSTLKKSEGTEPKNKKKKSEGPESKKKKAELGAEPKKKKKVEGAETKKKKSEGNVLPPSPKKSKGKNTKKLDNSIQNKQQNMIGIGSSMMAVAVEVKRNEENNVLNGKLATPRKRKSSAASVISAASPTLSVTPVSTAASGGTGEKSMPPKKRKRVASTPQEVDAIINAVAIGILEGCGEEKNCVSTNSVGSLGVIMQGIAPNPNKVQWKAANADDHSIMKGHAMGSNCQSDEIVTVKTSDLIDNVINSNYTTSANVKSYSPGFYSTSNNTAVGSGNKSSFVSSSPLSIGKFNSSTNKDEVNINPPVGLPLSSSSSTWDQSGQSSESQNQNVIKLHYDQSPADPHPVPVSVAPYSAVANTYQAPTTSSSSFGKCAACSKDEAKKNMVTCDKCAQDFHFLCLTPPLKYSPRRRGYSWYCSGCDDEDSIASGQENGLNSP